MKPQDERSFSSLLRPSSETPEGLETAQLRGTLRTALFATEHDELRIGRFVLGTKIGEGATGTVFRAHDPDLGRPVALKVLDPIVEDASTRDLLEEAKTLAQLNHPNVVTVHECGVEHERVYIAMELVEGGTLSDWLRAHSPDEPGRFDAALDLMVQAAQGLDAAHALGLVHRDLKPNNMLIDSDGRLRIADFGLARASVETSLEPATELDAQGRPIGWTKPAGTPGYMAPEQLEGRPTQASDQFSLCATFFRVFAGVAPFEGRTSEERLEAIRAARVQTPSAGHHMPRWLRELLERGLRAKAEDRFENTGALQRALQAGRTLPTRRRRTAMLGVGVVALAGAGIAAMNAGDPAVPTPCTDGETRWATVWSASRASDLEARAVTAEHAYTGRAWPKIASQVEQWGEAWTREYQEACEATKVRHEQSENIMQGRLHCLSRQLVRIDATLESLGGASAAAVVSALSEAPRPIECREAPQRSADDDVDLQGHIDEVLEKLQEARIALFDANYEPALDISTQAVSHARALDHSPTLAEALTVHARTLLNQRKPFENEAREAVQLAAEHGLPAIETDAWLFVAMATSGNPDADKRASDTSIALDAARAALVRAGSPPHLAARVRKRRGETAHILHSDLDRGAELYAETLELYRSAPNPPLDEVGEVIDNYAQLLSSLGRNDEGLKLIRWRLEYAESRLGAEHPECGRARQRLAKTLMNLGDLDGAERESAHALEIFQAAPVSKITLAKPHGLLGQVAMIKRDWARARAHIQRMLDLYAEHYDGTGMTASPLKLLGELELRSGNPERAKVHFERALTMAEESFGPKNPWMEPLRESLGRACLEAGDPGRARELFALVLPGIEQVYGEDATPMLPVMAKNLEALVALGDEAAVRDQLKAIERVRGTKRLGPETTSNVELAIARYEISRGDTQAATERFEALRNDIATADAPPTERLAREGLLFELDRWRDRHL